MSLSGRKFQPERAAALRELYRASLFDDVVPWWLKHSLDREFGGYYSLLERDGRCWGDDKYMWMNGRQVWMLSHLFNTHQQNPEWLDAARLGAKFMREHAFRQDGKMHFRLTRNGQSRSEVLSIYTEVFGAIAMAEYAKASGDESYWDRAMGMYDFLIPRGWDGPQIRPCWATRSTPSSTCTPTTCAALPFAWVYNEIRSDRQFEDDLTRSVDSILRRHWKPDMNALLENVAPDGSPMLDLPEGRMFHPGHAIESAWMLMEIARKRGDQGLLQTAIDILLASLKHGWDTKYGGLLYITNVDWTPTHSWSRT